MADIEERTPAFFVTTKGKAISSNQLLGGLAMKNESKQLDDSWRGVTGEDGLREPPYPPESLLNLIDVSTHHSTCCNIIAEDVAGSGIEIQPRPGVDTPRAGQKKTLQKFIDDLEDPLEDILTSMVMDEVSIGQQALELIHDNEGTLYNLKHVPVHTIRVHSSKKKYAHRRGGQTIWFHRAGKNPNTGENYPKVNADNGGPGGSSNAILYDKTYSAKSGYYGVPRIMPALGAILGEVSRQDYNNSFFRNYGVPAYAIFISGDYDPGPLTEDEDGRQISELEEAIEEHLSEIQANPGSTLLLTVPSRRRPDGSPGQVDVRIEKLGGEVQDSSFKEFRKDNRDEIFEAHGVPLTRAGLSDSGSIGQTSAEQNTENYKRSIVSPRQRRLEKRLNKVIVQNELGIEDWIIQFVKIDTKDENADVEVAVPLFGMGAITPNELIKHFGEKFNLQPVTEVEGMDHHFIGGKSIESGMALMAETTLPGQAPGSVDADPLAKRKQKKEEEKDGAMSDAIRQMLDRTDLDADVKAMLQGMLDSQRGSVRPTDMRTSG